MIAYNKNQLSLGDIYSECQDILETDKPKFLTLLEEHISLDEIIPSSFYTHFHLETGRPREYPLHGFLWALLLQKIFTIPTDTLLLVFLHYSKELREFCGFEKVPDASKITRFKQDFLPDLQSVFERLVDMTEPICQAIDAAKADMTIFDSSGIKAWVTENNPKYADRIVRQLKAYAKSMNFDDSYDPYKAAYASMPSCAHANPEIKQLYINGHFCYVYKFGLVTNGLGTSRSTTKTGLTNILILSWRKSPKLPMRTSLLTMSNSSFLPYRISSGRTRCSTRKPFSATLLSTPSPSTKNCSQAILSARTDVFRKHIFPSTTLDSKTLIIPSMNMAFHAAPMTRRFP